VESKRVYQLHGSRSRVRRSWEGSSVKRDREDCFLEGAV
jgi:hypothetical protein